MDNKEILVHTEDVQDEKSDTKSRNDLEKATGSPSSPRSRLASVEERTRSLVRDGNEFVYFL